MTKDLETAIQKISEGYREKTKEISVIEKILLDISKELGNENIFHSRFEELQKQKHTLENKLIEMKYIADGIAQAREMVFESMG